MTLPENNSYDDEISNYLNLYGIHSSSEIATVDSESMIASGYQEVQSSCSGQIDMIFQQLPGLVSHAISHHGTYRVYFDKSLGVLQQAKQGDGFFRANVVRAGTNNDISGQALLKAASAAPLVANLVFSALSMVTGQYFLSEINDKLSQIENKIDNIQQFLENEKRSDLLANYYYLQQVIQTFEYIQANDMQKQAIIQQFQKIRIDSLSNLSFYTTSFKQKKDELEKMKSSAKKNIESIPRAINEIGDILRLYKFSLYTYSLEYYLEIMLSGNTDSSYIDMVKKDIDLKIDNHRKLVVYFSDEWKKFINEVKAYKPNEFLKIIIKSGGRMVSEELLGSPILGDIIAEAINEKSDDAKIKAKDKVMRQAECLINECKDYQPFNSITQSLSNYNQIINNSQLELVYTDDKAYVKFNDIENINDENEAKK